MSVSSHGPDGHPNHPHHPNPTSPRPDDSSSSSSNNHHNHDNTHNINITTSPASAGRNTSSSGGLTINTGSRRPHAPSLDVMATQSTLPPMVLGVEDLQTDSRSSSSTNSPAPNDNEESDFFLGANDSQSSLGVPNLQDMQVTDDECRPPIHTLPNEILIAIFSKLGSPADQLHCMLTCKRWARNVVDLLWHRPSCTSWTKHQSICQTLGMESPYFAYRDFIKRINLASIADKVNDGSVMPLSVCTRVERLTLTNCKGLTDSGLIALVENSSHLLALDISGDDQITEASIVALANNCRRLQGLNVSNCTRISNEGMIKLAENCRFIKRLKLNDCSQLQDEAVLAFAEHCPNILEIDLHQCRAITNQPITNLLANGQALRELRLTNCDLIDDGAFLSLPSDRIYEHLRILDLTSCTRLTDRAVEKIIDVAPRLRNLVLAKCRNITDAAVYAIARLGKNLHYVHLGHCGHITDDAVKRLVQSCNRIRYIDLGCCVHLTDDSVTRLATLPKLKRIGLVKCSSITDDSVFALAKANQRHRPRRDAEGNIIENQFYSHSSLERVHLSYCTNLTLKSIIKLLNSCPRLTHLSLTGVPAFLRDDLSQFCRDAPSEFTHHQREVFCVFSGQGVTGLRRYLNSETAFAEMRDRQPGFPGHRRRPQPSILDANMPVPPLGHANSAVDGGFDDVEVDAIDDDDVLDDGSEMVIDTQALLATHAASLGIDMAGIGAHAIPPPPPAAIFPPLPPYATGAHYLVPAIQGVHFPNDPEAFAQYIPPLPPSPVSDQSAHEAMDVSAAGPSSGTGASTATVGLQQHHHSHYLHPPSPREHVASSAGPSSAAAGPSTASAYGGGDGEGSSSSSSSSSRSRSREPALHPSLDGGIAGADATGSRGSTAGPSNTRSEPEDLI